MNTQNVNVKTAAPESSRKMGDEKPVQERSRAEEWWLANLRLDGFVLDIHSDVPGAVISAVSLVERLGEHARRLSGLHWEIYVTRSTELALEYMRALPREDRHAFIDAAYAWGISVSYDALERSLGPYNALMAELIKETL